jgi:hypothetical protein
MCTPVLERTIDMAKFIYLYSGRVTARSGRTPEQGAERIWPRLAPGWRRRAVEIFELLPI